MKEFIVEICEKRMLNVRILAASHKQARRMIQEQYERGIVRPKRDGEKQVSYKVILKGEQQ